MDSELDLRTDDLTSDVQARARFEENRRFDRRPAIQELDQPATLVTTRRNDDRRAGWSSRLVATALMGGLLLLLLGVAIGVLLQRSNAEDATSTAFRAAPPNDEVGPVAAEEEIPATVPVETTTDDDDLTSTEASDMNQALSRLDLSRLSFEPGTDRLTPAGESAASELATILLLAPNEPAEILVRTFSESTPGLNHGLSVRQAEVVLGELLKAGVRSDRLRSVGLGSSGAERPTVAAAIRTEASDERLTEMIFNDGPLVLQAPFTGSFDESSSANLRMIGEFLADNQNAHVTLVGYAWSEDTEHKNHDGSHELLDAALDQIVASGATPSQISMVGLGEVNIQLADQLSEVIVDAGPSAAIGLSLGEIAVEAIEFDGNSANLTADGNQALESVAAILDLDRAVRVEIAVHTYSESDSQQNHDLSQRQADSIFEFLTANGVAADRLQLVAHGDPHHFAAPGRAGAVTFTVIR